MKICTSGPCVCSAAVKRRLDMITRLHNNHTTCSSIYGSFLFSLVLTLSVWTFASVSHVVLCIRFTSDRPQPGRSTAFKRLRPGVCT